MTQQINPIPELPDEIKAAINEKRLAIFFGAGVSRLVDCAGWDKLAHDLLETCYKTKKKGKRLINFQEKETLARDGNYKKLLTICKRILENAEKGAEFYKSLKKSLRYEKSIGSENIFKTLYGIKGLFITTNIDTHFDSFFNKPNIINDLKDVSVDSINIDNNTLYHLHGSITDNASLVLTVLEYIKHYNNPQVQNFLIKVFNEYTVLFIGYGLEELEVFEFVLSKLKMPLNPKHYILAPFSISEVNILSFEEYYYKDLNISVLPYQKDQNGYYQLYNVIQNWSKQIRSTTNYLHITAKQIKDAVDSFSEDKINPTLQKIKDDKSMKDYFFNLLSESPLAKNWLTCLNESSYFTPQNNPVPVEDPPNSGRFYTPTWDALAVLLNICKKLNPVNGSKTTSLKTVESILNEIIQFQLNDPRIDNYKTDATIIEILSTMPIDYINNTHIQFISSCFKTKFTTDLLASSISTKFLPYLIQNQKKDLTLELLTIIFQPIEIRNPTNSELSGIMSNYYLKKAISNNHDGILNLCSFEASKTVIQIIKNILSKDPTQFHYTCINTIEDNKQPIYPDQYAPLLVMFVKNMLEKKPSTDLEKQALKELVEELLNSDHDILRQLASHLKNRAFEFNEAQISTTSIKVGFVKLVSPVDKTNFLDMTNREKAKFIREYKATDNSVNFERKSLSYALLKYVQDSPENFTQKALDPFLNIPKKYQAVIIEGFKNAWKKDRKIKGTQIFNFITKMISEDHFWTVSNQSSGPEIQDCVKAISDLMTEAINPDSPAVLPKYLSAVEQIIITLFSKYTEEQVPSDDNPVDFILSSGIGHLLMASVTLSLNNATISTKKNKKIWQDSIRPIFDQRLAKADQATATSIVIAMHFKNIYFLDTDWLEQNFNLIFNQDNTSQWALVMSTFLSSNPTLLEFAYNELNKGGHYRKSLRHPFRDHQIIENLVYNIGLAYFYGLADINNKADSLILLLINKGSSIQLSHLIDFVEKQVKREDRRKDFQDKTRVLWNLIIKRMNQRKKLKSEGLTNPISKIMVWVALFDEVDDEILKLAKFSTDYQHATMMLHSNSLYTDLNRVVLASPKHTAELLLSIMGNPTYYDHYDQEEISAAVRKLYKTGEKEAANRICNLCLDKGYHFLIDIFNQYNH